MHRVREKSTLLTDALCKHKHFIHSSLAHTHKVQSFGIISIIIIRRKDIHTHTQLKLIWVVLWCDESSLGKLNNSHWLWQMLARFALAYSFRYIQCVCLSVYSGILFIFCFICCVDSDELIQNAKPKWNKN